MVEVMVERVQTCIPNAFGDSQVCVKGFDFAVKVEV
jgi:hypothetical protein